MGVLYEASQDDFLFRLDTVARYRVQDGKYITIEANEEATPEEVRLFLFGSAWGALLHQRKMLALHGSCVAKGKNGFLFVGPSAAGKSTLAAGFLKMGYSFVADDISVIGFDEGNGHLIYPGIPHLKLWRDVLLHLHECIDFERIRPRFEKYIKPIYTGKKLDPVRLENIILLSTKNTPGYHFKEISGSEKFNLLTQNTYRMQYLDKLNRIESHFRNLSRLVEVTKLFRVERPTSPLNIRELATFVEDNILKI